MSETKGLALASGGPGRSCPPPLHFTSAPSPSSGEPVTPTNKLGRRSFWDMLVTLLKEQGLIVSEEWTVEIWPGMGSQACSRDFEIRALTGLCMCTTLTYPFLP